MNTLIYKSDSAISANGNPLSIRRSGLRQNGTFGPVDDLTLSYDGCQLSAVEERAAPVVSANSYDLKRGSDDFAYDANGALTMDGTRGITNITYDYGGYPARVQFDNGNVTKYVYTSTGQKLRAVYYTAMPNVRVGMGMDYDGIEDNHLSVDSVDYLLGGTVLCRNGRATQILFDGGYVKVERRLPGLWKNPSLLSLIPNVPIITNDSLVLQPNPADTLRLTFKYFNKDHLGNIREVIGEDGTVEQVTDYYPFGLPMSDLGRNSGLQRFKYNGKEFDQMHGLNTYDYGARQYNPVLARWDRMDPLAEKYPHLSAYCYAADNPIRYIDPDGQVVKAADELARRNIINTLSTSESQYVQFDGDGTLNQALLNQYKGISENFIALKALSNSSTNYIFSVSNKDINGKLFYEKGDLSESPNNFSYGVTNLPNAKNDSSPDKNVYIYTASFLDERTQARNTAHEGYGHAYFYELSKKDASINPNHTFAIVGERMEYDPGLKMNIPVFIWGKNNSKLEYQIEIVERQALKNYDEKNH